MTTGAAELQDIFDLAPQNQETFIFSFYQILKEEVLSFEMIHSILNWMFLTLWNNKEKMSKIRCSFWGKRTLKFISIVNSLLNHLDLHWIVHMEQKGDLISIATFMKRLSDNHETKYWEYSIDSDVKTWMQQLAFKKRYTFSKLGGKQVIQIVSCAENRENQDVTIVHRSYWKFINIPLLV